MKQKFILSSKIEGLLAELQILISIFATGLLQFVHGSNCPENDYISPPTVNLEQFQNIPSFKSMVDFWAIGLRQATFFSFLDVIECCTQDFFIGENYLIIV